MTFDEDSRSVEPAVAMTTTMKSTKYTTYRNCLSSRPRLKAHTRGHPCRECWRHAGRARPLIRHAPGACHQQGISRPHPSLAAQGATVLRAGLFRRGASPPSPVFFLSLSPCAHRHLHCHASAGPRWRKFERRRSEMERGAEPRASLTSDSMTRPKLACACLSLSPDPVSLPGEHAGG